MFEFLIDLIKFTGALFLFLFIGLPLINLVLKGLLWILDAALGKEQVDTDSESDYYKAIYDESMLWQNTSKRR